MKLIDQFLIIDRVLIILSILLMMSGIVIFVRMILHRDFEKIKFSKVIQSISMIILSLYASSQISLQYQIGKVADINYLTKSITFNVKNGEKIQYKYNEFSKEYSSTNNTVVEGLNEIIGRYDFTYLKEIEQTGSNEWLVTFKCDCGKVKSATIGE